MEICACFAWIDLTAVRIPWSVTLGCACVFSYLIGRVTLGKREEEPEDVPVCAVGKVPGDLQKMAESFQNDLDAHQSSIEQFTQVVAELKETDDEEVREQLSAEAEETLRTTVRLASQLSCTNEELSRKVSNLKTPAVVFSDPVTGLQTRDALEESINRLFAMQSRYDLPFSVATFHLKIADGDVTREKIAVSVDDELKDVAALLTETVRDTDLVARYDKETFVALLPNTALPASIRFTQRAQAKAQANLVHSLFAGVATACDADDPASLLRRAVEASQQASAAGERTVYFHDGDTSHPSGEEEAPELETVAAND